MRLQSQASALSSSAGSAATGVDSYLLEDIKNVLKQQQDGIQVREEKKKHCYGIHVGVLQCLHFFALIIFFLTQALVSMMKEDLADLNLVDELSEKEKKMKPI